MKESLTVSGINAGYGKVPILHNLTIHVAEGEVVAVIGPNGAGKSTLLKTISGLIHPTSGTIAFEGRQIEGLPPHSVMKSGISHVPEGGRPFPCMTVLENLMMGAYSCRENLKTGVLDEVYALFPVLKKREKQLAGTLSGGEKQMLAIGRALASRPKIIMLDEPSLGLAPKLIDEIYDRLQMLRGRGLTVMLVEQNTCYALELADRGYVLENGRTVMAGSGQELMDCEHIKTHYLGL